VKYYQHNALNYVDVEKTTQDWPLKPGANQIATNGSGCGNRLAAAAKCCIEMEDQLMSVLNTQSGTQTAHHDRPESHDQRTCTSPDLQI
jgi:hypothetical protein